jgi:hypothetical protein
MYFSHLKSNIEHLKKGGVYFLDEVNAKKVGTKNATFVPCLTNYKQIETELKNYLL